MQQGAPMNLALKIAGWLAFGGWAWSLGVLCGVRG